MRWRLPTWFFPHLIASYFSYGVTLIVTILIYAVDTGRGEAAAALITVVAAPVLVPMEFAYLAGALLAGSFHPLAMAAVGNAVLYLIMFAPIYRHSERRRWRQIVGERGRCKHCGYDLRGSPVRCPECGFFPEEHIETVEEQQAQVDALEGMAQQMPAVAEVSEPPDTGEAP